MFDGDEYATERAELRGLLTEQEYAAASRSTTNAHFTDAALASAIWHALEHLGFDGGEVLEPGCGSGHFIGLAPAGAQMIGVEREPASAAIATALYPQAQIITGDFAELALAENTVDATVGNVPFSKATPADPKHNTGGHAVHNYFIIKSLHLTRPGGLVAVLTSRFTLDSRNPAARAEMAQLADLVGAIRLPSGAHRRAAGTEAVTDLLILRRREPDTPPRTGFAEVWERALPVEIGEQGTQVEINHYFLDNPDHVLGEFALEHGLYQDHELTVRGDLATVADRFASALGRICEQAHDRELEMAPRGENTPRPSTTVPVVNPDSARFAGFLTAQSDGTFTRRVDEHDEPYEPPTSQADELRALLRVRDAAMALIDAEQRSIDDTPHIEQLRAHLNTVYDTYTARYGPINRFATRRQLRQGWHVFGDWCDRHYQDRLPASPETVRDYLTELREHGLGQDQLQRHLDGMVKAHSSAFNKQVTEAAWKVAAKRARDAPDTDVETHVQQVLAETQPETLLHQTNRPDLRLPDDAIAAGQKVIAAAAATTDPDLDLDELGLRTTVIVRPPQGGFRDDPFVNYARALEKFDPTSQTARKADIFSRRVVYPPRSRLGADTPEEALSICLDTHSRVELPEIARLLGLGSPEEARAALGELVYDDPDTREPVWAPLYLSGNVRGKLARARIAADTDPAFAINVTALERVIPPDLGPEDIEVRLGSWIGPQYVQDFLRELLDDENVRVETVAGLWDVSSRNPTQATRLAAEEIWGGGGLNAYKLTHLLLVGTPIRVTKTVTEIGPDGTEREKQVFDPEATEEACDKAAEISARFADWVWEDTSRATEIMRQYNDTFNAEIPPDFAGVELSLPGLSQAFTLREHQKTAVARIIYQPATGLVHEVGAGKTLEIIVGMMERRRRGLATTPVVVVPNSDIAEQFEREWLQAYPGARLLTGLSDDLTANAKRGRDRRSEFLTRVATDDWDAVIMTKESFQRIPLPYEVQDEFFSAELEDLRAAKTAHADTMSQSMTKRVESAMEIAKARLDKRRNEIPRDVQGMTFVDSGIDYVCVDEAQNYKNGMINSAISDLVIEGSDRAIDLEMKLSWLQQQHGTARVVLATATPWTNTFSEIYLWLRRLGHVLPRFDVWARTFITPETFMEMTPGGTLRSKIRTRGVINEPELWRTLRLTSDIRMREDLNLPAPALRGGEIEIIEVPASVSARIFTHDLGRRERNLSGPPEKGKDNHLVIAHDGQLAALDVRAVGLHTSERQKVDVLADDLHTEWAAARNNVYRRDDGTAHPVRGGLILVFCDESVPNRKHWNFYTELRSQLVARGMPEESIRFIQEATSPQRQADLLAACREGAVSVLVGSTMRMGAGLNIQTRAIGGVMVTGTWRADVIAQARGRIERQGNQNPEFFWKAMVLAPSMDAKKYEITGQKHTMFAPLYSNTTPQRSRQIHHEDTAGLADIMAAATGDSRYQEKAALDHELKTLQRQHSSHQRTQQALKLAITTSTERIPTLEALAQRQDAVAARVSDTSGDRFRMQIGERTTTKRNDAGHALRDIITTAYQAAPRTSTEHALHLGTIGGLTVTATVRRPHDQVRITFPEASENTTGFVVTADELATANLVSRLENQLKTITTAGERTRHQIAEEQRSIEHARAATDRPFAHQDRLGEVIRRRDELINELREHHDDATPAPDEDPNSPEAKARAERADARRRERDDMLHAARDTAQGAGMSEVMASRFASWYLAIADPVTPDQRPALEPAFSVWLDLGAPDAHGRSRVEPQPAAADTEPASLSAEPTSAPPDTTTPVSRRHEEPTPATTGEYAAPPAETREDAPTPHNTQPDSQPPHTDKQTAPTTTPTGEPAPSEPSDDLGLEPVADGATNVLHRVVRTPDAHDLLVQRVDRDPDGNHVLIGQTGYGEAKQLTVPPSSWFDTRSRVIVPEADAQEQRARWADLVTRAHHHDYRVVHVTSTRNAGHHPETRTIALVADLTVHGRLTDLQNALDAIAGATPPPRADRTADRHHQPGEDDYGHPVEAAGVHDFPVITGVDAEHPIDPARWGWSRFTEEPTEIGAQQGWCRNDLRLGLNVDADDRLLADVYVYDDSLGDDAEWLELRLDSREDLERLLSDAGRHGIATPTRDPERWAITPLMGSPDTENLADYGPRARLAVRDEDSWSFVDTGEPVTRAEHTPVRGLDDRRAVIRYVLGDHHRDKQMRSWVTIALSQRARNGVYPAQALDNLAHSDPEIYRRVLTARAGYARKPADSAERRPGTRPFDVARAERALRRLANDDPALPVNSVEQYVELTEVELDADRISLTDPERNRVPVRGVVTAVEPKTYHRLRVVIERDVPSIRDTASASQIVEADAHLTVLDPNTRPTQAERANAAARMRVQITEHKRARGLLPENIATTPTLTTKPNHRPDDPTRGEASQDGRGALDLSAPGPPDPDHSTAAFDEDRKKPIANADQASSPSGRPQGWPFPELDEPRASAFAVVDEPAAQWPVHTSVSPLTDTDIAYGIRQIGSNELATFLKRARQGRPANPTHGGGWRTWRRHDEPDAGASVGGELTGRGLNLQIGTEAQARVGYVSWRKLARWLHPGLHTSAVTILEHVSYTLRRFASAKSGYRVLGEQHLAQQAIRELKTIERNAADTIITTALAAHHTGTAPGPRSRKTSRSPDRAPLTESDTALLARINQLASLLPTTSRESVAVSQLLVGDAVYHPGYATDLFRVDEPPVDRGDHVAIAGTVLRAQPDHNRTTIWPLYKNGREDPTVERVALPGSLTEIHSSPETPGPHPSSTEPVTPAPTPPEPHVPDSPRITGTRISTADNLGQTTLFDVAPETAPDQQDTDNSASGDHTANQPPDTEHEPQPAGSAPDPTPQGSTSANTERDTSALAQPAGPQPSTADTGTHEVPATSNKPNTPPQNTGAETSARQSTPTRNQPGPLGAVTLTPAHHDDALPLTDQLHAVVKNMPLPIRQDEPARLALIHGLRALANAHQPAEQQARILRNITFNTEEAQAVARQLDTLADIIRRNGHFGTDPAPDAAIRHLATALRSLTTKTPPTAPATAEQNVENRTENIAPKEAATPAEPERPPAPDTSITEHPAQSDTRTLGAEWSRLVGHASILGYQVTTVPTGDSYLDHRQATIAITAHTEPETRVRVLADYLDDLAALPRRTSGTPSTHTGSLTTGSDAEIAFPPGLLNAENPHPEPRQAGSASSPDSDQREHQHPKDAAAFPAGLLDAEVTDNQPSELVPAPELEAHLHGHQQQDEAATPIFEQLLREHRGPNAHCTSRVSTERDRSRLGGTQLARLPISDEPATPHTASTVHDRLTRWLTTRHR